MVLPRYTCLVTIFTCNLLSSIQLSGIFCEASDNNDMRDALSQQKSEKDIVKEKWVIAANKFDQLIWPYASSYIRLVESALEDSSLNWTKQCVDSTKFLLKGLQSRKHWALKFLDSTGKGRSGMAYGYVADIGNMDECITIDVDTDQNSKLLGKYCLASLDFPKLSRENIHPLFGVNFTLHDTPLKDTVYELYAIFMEQMIYTPVGFKFGICIPSECDQLQLQKFLQKQLDSTELTVTVSKNCEVLDQPMETHHLIALIILSSYSLFVIIATLWTWNDDASCEGGTLHLFNMVHHTNKLFAETTDPAAQKLAFFHGIRFFYQLAAIIFHSIDIYPFLPTVYAPMYIREWPFWLFHQGYKSIGFFVQIPFAVSGFLTYSTLFPAFKSRNGSVSFVDYIFKRWYRTTPIMLGVILFGYVWSSMGRGPAFRDTQALTIEQCSKYWWANVLYVNNWFNWDEMCLFHTWSFSADFQLYAVAFVILKLASHNSGSAINATIALILIGCFSSAFVTWLKDLTPFPDFDALDARQYDWAPWMYFHTYNIAPAYFVGMLAAILFLDDRRISEKFVPYLWTITVLMGLSTQFIPRIVTFDGVTNRWFEIIFAATHRVLFVAPFVWSGYLCAFDMGSWVQAMYSAKVWTPFGRMSTSVFLAHYSFIWFDLGNSQDYVSTRAWNLTMKSIYIVFCSYLYSYIIYLLFEGPSMAFAKTYLLPGKKKPTSVVVSDATSILESESSKDK